ncbi:unnamed protein product [Chironomus riparius]|uniref:E3 ubiquitin-protein ligase APD1-4 middle domain-containing protein n=1 Tax=Chironomus riparius TaxID=315576 RepID=A0A9N9S4A0_9DIPT|nr:unnamed protein product [Chironomus riparius]
MLSFETNEAKTNASIYYKTTYHYTSMNTLEKYSNPKRNDMQGVKRVLTFCCLVAIVPTTLIILPLYLKHEVFKDTIYSVAESDVLEVRQGISSIFCQEHVLKMNTSFNAFQLHHMPSESKTRKHIRLKKSMILPDDTLEYWGFYLMNGATVELKVCSLLEGSRILVVKGERNLRTCGLLEHNKNKFGVAYNAEQSQVKVTFETAAEIIGPHITTKEENPNQSPKETVHLDNESIFDNAAEELDDFTQEQFNDTLINDLKEEQEETTINNNEKDDQVKQSGESSKANKSGIKSHSKRDNKKQKRFSDSSTQKQSFVENNRAKRDTILDRGINHGGNAQNYHPKNESDSISSFENSLLECFDGQILVAKYFPPSKNCNSVKYLEQGAHLVSKHDVNTNGYYYYIFYSDNDDAYNNIHAVFDIFKPSYLYSNISETKGCINSTNCNFKVQMFSDEVVIVEVPTKDGIEHEDEDFSLLISQCTPRMSVYIIFPILVLIFVLSCAFI